MIDDNFTLTGRKVLVTGASSGIGQATAIYLSQLNAICVLTGRDEKRLNETLEKLSGKGHSALSMDLAEEEDLTRLFDFAVADGKKLNGLVHSAGASKIIPILLLKRPMLEQEMRINYFAFMELVRLFAKNKYASGGSIVGISSIAATQPEKGQTNYTASKAAMIAATQALAIELAPKKIRINTILPGCVQTRMADYFEEDELNAIMKRQLLGMIQPEDVAKMCAFLVSDMSKFSTGRQFYMDGGRLG